MTRILRVLALAVLVAVMPAAAQELPVADPEEVGLSSDRLDRLTGMLQEYTDDGRLPGATVLLTRNGHIVYEAAIGYRDREAGEPMQMDAIFRIASQTKAIISVGVMMLQEEGRLLIGDPVGRYLPEYSQTSVAVAREDGGYDVVRANRPITIRDLLTHTAGIGYGYGPGEEEWEAAGIQGWYFGHREEPIRETIRDIAGLPMWSQPGSGFAYGYATDILGALIEVVSGQPLDEFLQQRILYPLDMRDTHFYLPEHKRDRLAVVYSLTADGLVRAPDESAMEAQGAYVDGPRASFSGGAGLLSTARDYTRFLQMMLNGGELNGVRLLSPTTVRLMTTNHLDRIEFPWMRGVGFGLGFQVMQDVGAFGAPGSPGEFSWGGAYHSAYWADPVEDLVVVYFTQVTPAGSLDDHGKLRALVYGAIVE